MIETETENAAEHMSVDVVAVAAVANVVNATATATATVKATLDCPVEGAERVAVKATLDCPVDGVALEEHPISGKLVTIPLGLSPPAPPRRPVTYASGCPPTALTRWHPLV